jgi:hypothetical protein
VPLYFPDVRNYAAVLDGMHREAGLVAEQHERPIGLPKSFAKQFEQPLAHAANVRRVETARVNTYTGDGSSHEGV